MVNLPCVATFQVASIVPVIKSWPIPLKFLPIMLLSSAQKLPIMLNIMPLTTAIMPQFAYDFIIFND